VVPMPAMAHVGCQLPTSVAGTVPVTDVAVMN
jgi:hypothetical protein